jgi:carbamoyltransferase
VPLSNVYLGPGEGDETQIRSFLKKQKEKGIIDFVQPSDMPSAVAKHLTAGEIIARCSGRMEFGARALGNRSILADPSNPKIVPVINKMIKKRDFWMPFAPVVLEERIHDYLINPKKFLSPFMMLSFDTTENRDELWAGLHSFDMSARAQTVNEKDNGEYYRIIKSFEKNTGRGVLLNTSFNLHGSPIVLDYTNAWSVFVNSGLQIMQIGHFIVQKTISPCPATGCTTRSSKL